MCCTGVTRSADGSAICWTGPAARIGRQWLLATRLPARAGNATAHYTIKERRSAVATACVRFLAWSFAIALRT